MILVLVAVNALRYSSRRLADFGGYYTAARILTEGRDLPRMYEDSWFSEQVLSLGIDEPHMLMYVNPPPVTLLVQPVAWLSPFPAKWAWLGLLSLLLLGVFFLARRALEVRSATGHGVLLGALLFSSQPWGANLRLGQAYVVMLLLVLLLWIGYHRRQPWLAGASLAVLFALKCFGGLFLLYFALRRRWRELGFAILFSGFLFVGGLLLFGLETYEAYWGRLVASFRTRDAASTGLPCVPAFWGGFFVESQYNPEAVTHAPWLYSTLTLLSLVGALFWTLKRADRRDGAETREQVDFTFFAVLVLSVIFTPLAADHHYLLMTLPLFVLLASVDWPRVRAVEAFGLLLLCYLILGWLPRLSMSRFDGWTKLVCYARLYGAVALWLLLVRAGWRLRRPAGTSPF